MSGYQTKPKKVKAEQYKDGNFKKIKDLCLSLGVSCSKSAHGDLLVGGNFVDDGDFFVVNQRGQAQIIGEDDFERQYEPFVEKCPHRSYRVFCNKKEPKVITSLCNGGKGACEKRRKQEAI